MNKIGWCSMTWNPAWGCLNHCEYCYGRRIAKRFGERMAFWEMKYKYKNYFMGNNIDEYWEFKNHLQYFKPVFLDSQFNKKFPKKPQKIFVGSMSEIYYWEDEWLEKVLEKVKQYPQHIFQFLTKFPEVYCYQKFPQNCWLGITINKDTDLWEDEYDYYNKYFSLANIKFLSLEPILEKITILDFIEGFDWVIIGAETGNRKGKVIPQKQWIWDIINYCQQENIPIYVKDSIGKLYSQFGGIKEFPEVK